MPKPGYEEDDIKKNVNKAKSSLVEPNPPEETDEEETSEDMPESEETPETEVEEGETNVKLSPEFQQDCHKLLQNATKEELRWVIQEATEYEREMNKAQHSADLDKNMFSTEGMPE